MKILNMHTITGPNVYHHRPVLIMDINLESFTDKESTDIPEFSERLITLLPGLNKHFCSPGYPGGFVERLKKGTYFAHMIEHIALELSELAGIGVDFGKSIYAGMKGHYQIIVRYKSEQGMKYLLESAVELARYVAEGLNFDLNSCLRHAQYTIQKNELGPSASVILEAAKRRNIPWSIVNEYGLIQVGHGKYRQYFQSTTTSKTSDIAVDIAQDKNFTKKILEEAAIRVPRGRAVHSAMEAMEVMQEIPSPLAVKPHDGNHGRGISLNVMTEEELVTAFNLARKYSDIVLIEEFLKGKDYRIILVDGRMIAAAERTPAHVTGDGVQSIKDLIEKENANLLRGEGHEKPLTKITIDEETNKLLEKNHMTLTTIPLKGERVFLKETANLSTGGIAADVTELVHPEIKFMCERAARIVGLDVCGVDIIAENISLPINVQSCGIIEVNAGPGIRMHHYPTQGKSRDVGAAIIDQLFPTSNGRIPIIAITGTNGKTTISRVLSHIISGTGNCVGNTTTDGIFINNIQVAEGDTTGPISAKAILMDPTVEVAVLETARGGILKRGLGYDWSDVGIFTNLKLDHIGQDGIETIEDLLKIKSLIIERVKIGGTIILNADSPIIVKLKKELKETLASRKVVYFSLQASSRVILDHLEEGGHAYFMRGNEIIEAQGSIESKIINVDLVPLSMRGTARFHIANIMACIAAAHALDIHDDIILHGLMTFDHQQNQGRTNLYRVGPGYLLLDYGHNPDAIEAIGDMINKWNVSATTAIITAPGDRSDEVIKQSGVSAAWGFDKIIIREDLDLRGREKGVISSIIEKAIFEEKPFADCRIIKDSAQALKMAITEMKEKELVIYFYENYKGTEKMLAEINATPVTELDSFLLKKDEHMNDPTGREEWPQYSS